MSNFFYNVAAKIACFLINCKILVTLDREKQTLLLAGYKHTTIDFENGSQIYSLPADVLWGSFVTPGRLPDLMMFRSGKLINNFIFSNNHQCIILLKQSGEVNIGE